MCVDLSDYNRYLNQIWYRTQILPYQHAGMANSHKLKIQDGGGRHLGFRKMLITPNWIELFAQKLVGRCITSRPCGDETWLKVEMGTFLRDVIIMMNKDVYIK